MNIARKQKKILQRIYDFNGSSSPHTPELTGILKMITHYSEDQAILALKDFGIRLRTFADAIDLENPHPDLFNAFEGELTGCGEESFNRIACDVLTIVANAPSQISLRVLTALRDLVVRHRISRHLTVCLDGPQHNQMNVRFVKSQGVREIIRATKKVQSVGYLRGEMESCWDAAPSDFELYWRNTNRFDRDIKHAQDRQSYFQEFGLEEMSQAIDSSIHAMRDSCEAEQYYGFNRIDLITASVILAKMVGYSFCQHSYNSYVCGTGNSFGDYEFMADSSHSEERIEYSPMLYIYPSKVVQASEVTKPYLPSKMKELVEFLDAFPEVGGHPLFDHYRILVPGLNYPGVDNEAYRNESGEVVKSLNFRVGKMEFDRYLVEHGHIPAVLLGERDGEHYFISYFL